MSDVQNLFKREFGQPPFRIVKAPGRLELLGNHTDYNQGVVMSLAVDKYIHAACSPRNDGKIELVSSAFPGRERFTISELARNPEAPWADYVKGVLFELRRLGIHFSGFNAAIHGTVPIGAGMSSSAALEVASALAVRELYPYTVTETGYSAPPTRDRAGLLPPSSAAEKLALAKLCQRAENQFVGVQCGILDQISSLFGKAFHAVLIDCQDVSVGHAPMFDDAAVVVCDSGVKHALTGGEYNELRRHCESAAAALGVPVLRRVEMPELKRRQASLTPREFECALHIVGEIQRVVFGERALREGDIDQFGQYMFLSHESSRDFFRNSTPELDTLVELAREHPACIGARLTGGGFGGATINLVRRLRLEEFCAHMSAGYKRRTGHPLSPILCHTVDGAG